MNENERAYARLYKRFCIGGGCFGWDWVTFKMCHPQVAAEMRRLLKLI